jgi:hypothetical protein
VIAFTRKPADEDAFKKVPLTWTLLRVDRGWSAMAVCPNGHEGSLDDHTIADDGMVTPSVVCPAKNCDFHDSIKLEGWLDG